MKPKIMFLFVAFGAFLFAAGAMTLFHIPLQQVVKTHLQDLQGALDPDVINLLF